MTDVLQRRHFTADYKAAILAETMQPGISTTFVARRHGLNPSLVFRWKREMKDAPNGKAGSEHTIVPFSNALRLEDRVRELERVLGRKTMEIELLKEALELSQAAKPIVRSPSAVTDDST